MQEDHKTRIKQAKTEINDIIKKYDLVGVFVLAAPQVVAMDRSVDASFTAMKRINGDMHLLSLNFDKENREEVVKSFLTTISMIKELKFRLHAEARSLEKLEQNISDGLKSVREANDKITADNLDKQAQQN